MPDIRPKSRKRLSFSCKNRHSKGLIHEIHNQQTAVACRALIVQKSSLSFAAQMRDGRDGRGRGEEAESE